MERFIILFVIISVINNTIFGIFSVENSTIPRKTLYPSIYSKYEGDIYLAALFSIHHAGIDPKCGRIIDQDGLQVLAAATYGIKMVEKSMNLPVRIGLLAVDTCQDPIYGLDQSKDFMLFKSCRTDSTFKCSNNENPTVKDEYKNLQRVFGIFGAGNSDVSILAATFLRLVELPQISFFSTSPDLSDPIKYPGFFRSIPSDIYTVQAIAYLLREYNWNYILIVDDDSAYSTSTKDSFKSFIKMTNNVNNSMCTSLGVTISQDRTMNSITSAIKKIKDKIKGEHAPKVVVTFLTQAVVEDLLNYVEINPVEEFLNLIWIGTDSWGGRKWPNVTKNNSLMNKSISIIPNVYPMDDFMDYYKKRLPSIDDYDPWIAEKFEIICGCQYSNISLFIYPELLKIRKPIPGKRPCEAEEHQCSKFVYKDSEQMPYIHYVMDGILAYAHVVKSLIGTRCHELSNSECADIIWKENIISNNNITEKLKTVEFTDSTNETFRFWKEKEGFPHYSILFFNKVSEEWDHVGSLFDYIESRSEFNIKINKDFEINLKTNYIVSPCSKKCKKGHRHIYTIETCCWNCEECRPNEIFNSSDNKCYSCPEGFSSNDDKTQCNKLHEVFLSLNDLGALIIVLGDIFGLLICVFTFVILNAYWNTPIIKAFGKETGLIILIGTVLSFSFSMVLFGMPTNFRCYIHWFAPAFCSTICYAAILTKTNRIVRIFGLEFSSKTKNTPRFISPMSQISIIVIITLIECCVIIIIIVFGKVGSKQKDTDENVLIWCKKMDPANLVSVFFIPSFLLLCSTVYAFKMRKTPDGFNETRNINFMNFANCVVLVTSLFLYQLLENIDMVYPLCLQLTLGAYSNLICLFAPKIYLVLCRPEKNTIESVIARSRTRSQLSLSQANTSMSDLSPNLTGSIRCRKCNTLFMDSIQKDQNNDEQSLKSNKNNKPQTKVFFANDYSSQSPKQIKDDATKTSKGTPNQAFIDEDC